MLTFVSLANTGFTHGLVTRARVERVYDGHREVRRFGSAVALFLEFQSDYFMFLNFHLLGGVICYMLLSDRPEC